MRIGIDLGGTKIESIAMQVRDILLRSRMQTPRDDYEGTLRAIADLIQAIQREIGQSGTVGVGIPGVVSPATGLVKNANSTWLIGKPFNLALARAFGQAVRVTNDANCFALSEATDGAGECATTVFGVIVGTGTGGGVVIDGQVIEGRNQIAGEWGHNPLPWPENGEWPGPACYCGRTGCIETFLSGPGLSRAYLELSGEDIDSRVLVARADAGEAHASRALDRYELRMARALAAVINLLDPDIIVLGGGLSNIARLYANVPALWGPFVFSDRVDTPLVRAKHGDSSGVRGAAWLWGE
jgi:fructokinase